MPSDVDSALEAAPEHKIPEEGAGVNFQEPCKFKRAFAFVGNVG